MEKLAVLVQCQLQIINKPSNEISPGSIQRTKALDVTTQQQTLL